MAEPRRDYDDKLALTLRAAAEISVDKGYHDTGIREIVRPLARTAASTGGPVKAQKKASALDGAARGRVLMDELARNMSQLVLFGYLHERNNSAHMANRSP